MVLKFDDMEQLYFLESTQDRGVCITGWDDFKIFNDRYADIFHR